jgi:rare lipoprotein A
MSEESRALGIFRCAPLILAAIAFSSCRPKVETHPPGGYVQTGVASWYGEEFHGRKTSSLEVYDMNDLTAAHNTLPLGTFVAVTNLNNSRSVIVRINDRGPFVKNRVIDLSYAAARAIDMIGTGTAPVRIEVLADISPPLKALSFSVQTGSFSGQENAEAMRGEVARQFADVYVSTFETPQQVYYRVRIRAKDRETAETIARALTERGYTAIIFEEK